LKTHLYITDSHALAGTDLGRATWLGKLILDIKPDVVVHGGDSADMPSLCSYERGTKDFQGRLYKADIEAHVKFSDLMMQPIKKAKRKKPRFVFIEGNHENRIKRALQVQPELEGAISFNDLALKDYYDDVIEYSGNTPGCICVDGITYSHYFVTGVSGKPTSSSSPGSLTLSKSLGSVTQGHSHVLDYATRPTITGNRVHSLVGGCFLTDKLVWAGMANHLWWSGCFIKRSVNNGDYDLQVISMKALKKEYDNNK
jgi:hypothetical protein